MIPLKSAEEIELIRESAQLVSRTLGVIAEKIEPGVSTLDLDKIAFEFISDHGAHPGFLGLYDFPNSLCTSVNEQIVHGIPNNKPLEEGDIVSVDCGVFMNGFYGDHAWTFEIGEIAPDVKRLLDVTKECLYLGIEQVQLNKRIGDVSYAIQQHAEKNGYGVVRELVGHGLGRDMHESPEVPNYGKRGKGPKINNGLVIAIEPMINMGTKDVRQLNDGWTIITADHKPSGHYEHNVAVIDGKPQILSTFKYIEEALAAKEGVVA
ncbi:MAG: type I methionyl aminopeptidase [Cyclobacteriaceae bacterium]